MVSFQDMKIYEMAGDIKNLADLGLPEIRLAGPAALSERYQLSAAILGACWQGIATGC